MELIVINILKEMLVLEFKDSLGSIYNRNYLI